MKPLLFFLEICGTFPQQTLQASMKRVSPNDNSVDEKDFMKEDEC
jgi:hypothetical protein